MRLSVVLYHVVRFLLPAAVIFTTYLYLYPIFHGCGFPSPARKDSDTVCFLDGQKPENERPPLPDIAPLRLLALGDPQLEGDSSLPKPDDPWFPSLRTLRARIASDGAAHIPANIVDALAGLIRVDIPRQFSGLRKRLDLLGNDYYLAHIYRSVRWWSQPTHTVVLGDLLGSQWISDDEFERRTHRFWNRVFKDVSRVPDRVAGLGDLDEKNEVFVKGRLDALDDAGIEKWKDWLITVAGNHDIGYAGDIDQHRIDRFEKAYGRVNWEARFQLSSVDRSRASRNVFDKDGSPPKLRLVMLNSMNMDGPVYQRGPQEATHGFLSREMGRAYWDRKEDATILLTHIPLYKASGLCADGPFFTYFEPQYGGGVQEQNHLTVEASDTILDGFYANGQKPGTFHQGIILNGHDHEGCDIYHYQPPSGVEADREPPSTIGNWTSTQTWWARRYMFGKEAHGIREITVRSMMGSFGGNAGFLSAWFDTEIGEWRFEYDSCVLGVQHLWWAIHIFDLVVLLLCLALMAAVVREWFLERIAGGTSLADKEKKTQ